MLQPNNKTKPFLLQTEEQIFNKIIEPSHPFRKLKEIIDFETLVAPLHSLYSNLGTAGIARLEVPVQSWQELAFRPSCKLIAVL